MPVRGKGTVMKTARKVVLWVAAALGIVLLAIQFVPVDRTNPPVQTEVTASAEVKSILKRACYDCHSNQTRWPWYSYIAPMSWLAAKDVKEGREKLNFSTWNTLSAEEQADAIAESWEVVQKGEMPLWFYLPMHPEAQLSSADKQLLQQWAASSPATGSDSGTGGGESDED